MMLGMLRYDCADGGRSDAHGVVGHRDGQRVLVGLRVDGDGLDAHLLGGPDDAQCDFAAVGDEDTIEHGHLRLAGLVVEEHGPVLD